MRTGQIKSMERATLLAALRTESRRLPRPDPVFRAALRHRLTSTVRSAKSAR